VLSWNHSRHTARADLLLQIAQTVTTTSAQPEFGSSHTFSLIDRQAPYASASGTSHDTARTWETLHLGEAGSTVSRFPSEGSRHIWPVDAMVKAQSVTQRFCLQRCHPSPRTHGSPDASSDAKGSMNFPKPKRFYPLGKLDAPGGACQPSKLGSAFWSRPNSGPLFYAFLLIRGTRRASAFRQVPQ
jgi:hypothetical protein